MAVRRVLAKRSMRLSSASWPINELAGTAPEWWTGWPDNKKFAFVLTHDAEGQKGLDRSRELADMEIELGFRSSFNFVPEGEYETPCSLRDFLTTHGFEVGVHDLRHDGKLYSSRKNFRSHAQKINQYLREWGAVGFRSAFMLRNFEWLCDLNVLYDASSFDTDPFEPQPDGVNTIFPFWVDRRGGGGYVELPYTLPQDSTLFLLLRHSGIDTWIEKLDWVAQHGGLALINVHPDYLNFNGVGRASEYSAQLYRSFLEYVNMRYRQDAWFALPKEVAQYVRNVRSSFIRNVQPTSATGFAYSIDDQLYSQVSSASLSSGERPSEHEIAANDWQLCGKRAAMVTFSFYPGDPRPRRAAEALVAKGMSVDFICLLENPTDAKHELSNGIDIRRISIKRRRGSILTYAYQYSAFLMISSLIIARRLITRGYDLVYVHNMPDFLVLSALLPKLCGAKVVLDLHDPMPELMTTIFGFQPASLPVRLLKRIERWSLALADSVVTVNRACAKLFTSRSCRPQKMNVVMNSPDERIFHLRPSITNTRKTDNPDKPFVIMYHGSVVERNGLDIAVEALAQVRQSIPNAQLRIYGASTPFLIRVLDSIRNMGLEQAVQYLGPKSLEQLVGVIEECDLGIIPNRKSVFTELNTPTRIFEYLALGRPVIAPRAAGIRDYFDDGSLVFFELGNAGDLAEKIKYVFSHPREVTEIVRRGQKVYQQHSWSSERLRLTGLAAGLLSSDPRVDPVSLVAESPKFNL
jgi:glycosyltransferase involved in cell wall biosynthesis